MTALRHIEAASEPGGTAMADLLSAGGLAAVEGADAVSLVECVQELMQELQSHQIAMMVLVRRVERLETLVERPSIGPRIG